MNWREAPAASYAVIGESVEHSLSPHMQNAALRSLGLDDLYVGINVSRGEVGQALDHLRILGYKGVNVTIPHKEEVIGWVRDIDPRAMQIGAVNTIKLDTRQGWNTDYFGVLGTLHFMRLGHGSKVLLIGAGGAAKAVAFAFKTCHFDWKVFNRTRTRAEELARKWGGQVADRLDVRDFDLIVNTTPSSKQEVDLGIDWSKAKEGAIAWDLFYGHDLTHFLQPAAEAGLQTVDGSWLLVLQGFMSLSLWLGKERTADVVDVMKRAVDEALRK